MRASVASSTIPTASHGCSTKAGARSPALDGAVVGVAPHSLRAATPEELRAVTALAGDGPIHIHVAEQMKEVEDCLAWSGARPVEWLLANAAVDRRWCLIHATHMTDAETDGIARSGAVAGLCPITEANLGDGIFAAGRFLDAGGRFGIGTDSNVLIGVADELRQLEYSQRLAHRARNVLGKRQRLDRAPAVRRSAARRRTGAWRRACRPRGRQRGRPRLARCCPSDACRANAATPSSTPGSSLAAPASIASGRAGKSASRAAAIIRVTPSQRPFAPS